MTFFKRAFQDQSAPQVAERAPALRVASRPSPRGPEAANADASQSGRHSRDIIDEIRERAQGSGALLVESRSRLGAGWELSPMPDVSTKSWLQQAVLLERRAERGTQHLMLIRQDRYMTSAGVGFRREAKEKLRLDCYFCMATAAVVSELLERPVAQANQVAQQSNVSNPEQRGYEIILRAIALDASDIHIEVVKDGRFAPRYRLRMRVNGKVRTCEEATDAAGVAGIESVITALFQNPKIAHESEKSHSTFNPLARCYASLKPPVKKAELRFECNPTVDGYKVVMRLLSYDGKTAAGSSLHALGLSEQMERQLLRATFAPSGLVLVVGATGSGKTTTIATALEADRGSNEKIRVGMEIPPEIGISELAQYKVNLDTLPQVAVGVARSDPDVIYAGEINNHATALMAQDYALTGHLTLATFHANSAAAALMRLMGDAIQMDPAILGMERFLRAVLYQSLVPLLCPDCKQPAADHLEDEQLDLLTGKFGLSVDGMYVRYRHTGDGDRCDRCAGTGEIGRTAIAELVVPDRKFLDFIMDRNVNAAMDHFRSQRDTGFDSPDTRGKTFVEHALSKAAAGEVCILEVFDNVEDLFTYEIRPTVRRDVREVVPGAVAHRTAAEASR
ncbi:GspE/PulE family protein [Ramlibacter albus]|uniref:Flp pilus assembly complex ATPase component TadA n=1 Tax=Ramlibacter albus TaxID=2079448 RepID=A0A923MCH0_9BURK|nr:Flp pilus assembly complex ATPase component TadA [Ramlibacter albus]